ncbi:MAG TPA: NAD(P)/FAD-dependent oxidoreductase [Solirubrobacterales bacterium]|jgi:2-polyprenyl-6-methoxyphenol hydroxylase-like FAD-dependent oxidoreductase|nr:NAD(P)/FAD-dependent oxidoreductase [Solirubrobacterales bacterium]
MTESAPSNGSIANGADYDVAIAGASLAGCATAILLGRAGFSVALVEKRPDPSAFKRTCSHFIQASGVPALERLGMLEPVMEAGGLRTRMRAWTPWGWIEAPEKRAGQGVNLRRELLDPMLREAAAATPGVELMLGLGAHGLLRDGEAVRGLTARARDGEETELRANLVVGADGRDSHLAQLAGVSEKILPHGRFAYGAYFDGPPAAPDNTSTIWMLDPHWAAAFPTDSGLIFYAAMPTKERLPEFRRDPEAALVSFIAGIPEAPPIGVSQLVGDVLGKIEMPNRVRVPVAPGLALAGDAALAVDPLFGIGCGWALQSAEWLTDSVTPALRGAEPLQSGLDRYRRRHRKELRGHSFIVNDYATGRRLQWGERMLFAGAARDPEVAAAFDEIGTRRAKPGRTMAKALPRAIAVNARHSLARRGGGGSGRQAAPPQRLPLS